MVRSSAFQTPFLWTEDLFGPEDLSSRHWDPAQGLPRLRQSRGVPGVSRGHTERRRRGEWCRCSRWNWKWLGKFSWKWWVITYYNRLNYFFQLKDAYKHVCDVFLGKWRSCNHLILRLRLKLGKVYWDILGPAFLWCNLGLRFLKYNDVRHHGR